jgi:PAS domain S-box-containing protein
MAQSDSCPLAQFRRFRALLDAIPQPAILKDTEGRIALANAAASRLWNKEPEELVGLTSGDLVDPASACWAEAVDTLALYSSAPKLLRRKMKLRGQQKSFLVSVAPVYLSRGERPDGIIVVVQPDGMDAAIPADSAEAVVLRQFAELALIRCELRDEQKRTAEEAEISARPLPSLQACVERGAFGSAGPDLPGGIWLPLKRLLKL